MKWGAKWNLRNAKNRKKGIPYLTQLLYVVPNAIIHLLKLKREEDSNAMFSVFF